MERVTFTMRVKKGHHDEYVLRHKAVWPEVMAEHRRAGIMKMAIYMKDRDLFLYMEVEDYAKAVRILGRSAVIRRWEEYMAPIMEDLGDHRYDPANAYPPSLPEVFFWEPSDLADAPNPPSDGDYTLLPSPHVRFSHETSQP